MARPALVPEFYVSDLAASLQFYLDVLGFQVEYDRPEEGFAALRLGEAHLMLEETPSLSKASAEELSRGQWRIADLERPFGRGMNLEIQVSDIDAIDARVTRRGYPRVLELHQKTYRIGDESHLVQQLLLADPDGYLIRLSQTLSPNRTR